MTGSARQNEHVRLAPLSSSDASSFEDTPRKELPAHITWLVAVCACATALVVKLSQQWLILVDEHGTVSNLGATFDWAAILLCTCALALIALQTLRNERRTAQSKVQTTVSLSASPELSNLALPTADDSRLRLAQSLSHELRTPLNAVIGFTDLMNHELHGNLGHPKYNEYCAHISASSQSLLRTVDDILALNHSAAHDLTNRVPLPIAKALRTAWEENSQRDIPTDTNTKLEISGDRDPSVIADPEILSHALKNMVDTLNRHAAADTPICAVIRNEEGKTRLYCTAQLDEARMVDTAPLPTSGTPTLTSDRITSDTLSEVAAEALVRQMDGKLVIRRPKGTLSLEVICDLPAPRNENTHLEGEGSAIANAKPS